MLLNALRWLIKKVTPEPPTYHELKIVDQVYRKFHQLKDHQHCYLPMDPDDYQTFLRGLNSYQLVYRGGPELPTYLEKSNNCRLIIYDNRYTEPEALHTTMEADSELE